MFSADGEESLKDVGISQGSCAEVFPVIATCNLNALGGGGALESSSDTKARRLMRPRWRDKGILKKHPG